MAKRGRHKRGGRVTPKGTRPMSHGGGSRHAPRSGPPELFGSPFDDRFGPPPGPEPEPELMGDIRAALRSPEPLDLLSHVSMLLAVTDPSLHDPFGHARDASGDQVPSLDELVRSFADINTPETSALLAVIAELSGDEVQRARIRRMLAGRHHRLPAWIERLAEADAYRAVEMVHVLGDGDNVIIGTRLPPSHELSVVAYIDHNLGTVMKDAFVVPGSIDELIVLMRTHADDPDTEWRDIDLADARARMTEAIELGAIMVPRFETDTWPACRPLVEWVGRLLPGGGTGYERPQWDDAGRSQVAERFLASPFAAGARSQAHREMLDAVLWFATDYGPGDPLRWSPTAVEILLVDWIPRKILAPAGQLARAPDVVRALIRYSHHERGIRPELTEETLAAVDQFEPGYQRTIRSPRPQGPAALIQAMRDLDPDGPWGGADPSGPGPAAGSQRGRAEATWGDDEPWSPDDPAWLDTATFPELMLQSLREAVGGGDQLDALDDTPLPDEALAWDGIPDDVHARVAEVAALCDGCCEALLDTEHRTACRRLLARIARTEPAVFRRRARADTAAAAICWIVAKANEAVGAPGARLLVKDLGGHFGIGQSVSQRAGTLLRAAGLEASTYAPIKLGSPDYLVGAQRRRIIERRDRYRAMRDEI